MIYDFPDENEPIRQGDIFKSVPQISFDPDRLIPVFDDSAGKPRSWLDTPESKNHEVLHIQAQVVSAFGIVVTQDCDTERDDYIALFKIDEFLNVEKNLPGKNELKWWVTMITKHARVKDKWFYLPPDDEIGFSKRMVADFQTIIPVPTAFLANHLGDLRIGRLKPEPDEHFREKVAQYFRRYPYNEWYPLNADELDYYNQQQSEEKAKPYPWQKRDDS